MKGSFSEYDPKTGKHKDTFFGMNKPEAAKPKPQPPPTPDPFEEAWNKALDGDYGSQKGLCRHFWDAAIRWKEGE